MLHTQGAEAGAYSLGEFMRCFPAQAGQPLKHQRIKVFQISEKKERMQKKVWSGRVSGSVSQLMEEYSRSTETDHLMWREDIAVNRAWAAELAHIGVFTPDELECIGEALATIEQEFSNDQFTFLPSDEDIHVAIERRLTELAGAAGARIHTGRSRNDQVATDARLWIRRMAGDWREALLTLQTTLLARAEEHVDTVLPGYTHWQQAQP
ncbi:MAG TPA: hypothetical protein ENJ29_11245, partial [Bacteroidetes bacterium]|nr:hypothetical protein [Bacteroidota bacterium]